MLHIVRRDCQQKRVCVGSKVALWNRQVSNGVTHWITVSVAGSPHVLEIWERPPYEATRHMAGNPGDRFFFCSVGLVVVELRAPLVDGST